MSKLTCHSMGVVLKCCAIVLCVVIMCQGATANESHEDRNLVWRPLAVANTNGLLGNRLELWRTSRMRWLFHAQGDYLLAAFENRPGVHPWQGEHFGKWLHAATLAGEQTHDKKLLKQMQVMVQRLLATQDPSGYMGTYTSGNTFMAMPENKPLKGIADDIETGAQKGRRPKRGWDTWTHRYNLYGLLTYERYHPNARIVEACERMADLLIKTYGEGRYDLTKYGTRQGISATTLLESIVMLYQRTRNQKYLDFAEHIVAMSEARPELRLMGNMLERGSVVRSGDGKAYQLMANLLGYCRLYHATSDDRYLQTARNGWQDIETHHLYVTGGPWGRKMAYNGNKECFAYPKDFDPELTDVETCSTTTWIQLNLHLLELTGEAKYAAEAERAAYNALLAAQHTTDLNWNYFTKGNQKSHFHTVEATTIHCCSSSGPRALEMFSSRQIGESGGALSFASLTPASTVLPERFGAARIEVVGNYPLDAAATIRFHEAAGRAFPVEFCAPCDTRLTAVRINGDAVTARQTAAGFFRVRKAWESGDKIEIQFEYQLGCHVERPANGRPWVAFTYGPWALAQGVSWEQRAELPEPFAGKDLSSKPASQWLEAVTPIEPGVPTFRVIDTRRLGRHPTTSEGKVGQDSRPLVAGSGNKPTDAENGGSEILLEPYCFAANRGTGVRTYFALTSDE